MNESFEETEILQEIRNELEGYDRDRKHLIPILQLIQKKMGYLPPEAIRLAAERLGLGENQVYGVATFYNQFRFHPPGKNPIKVCMGTACHVKAGDIILENFERKLGIREGETTSDREFSLERVACVGCCALAPVAVVGETIHGKMAPSKTEGLVLQIRMETEKREKVSSENALEN